MFQSLLAEIKEYKKPSFLASFYMFLEVIFEISIPFVMALLLDKGVQMGDMRQVALYGGRHAGHYGLGHQDRFQ